MLSIIVAAAENGVIGNQGQIPWRLPADLARFKQLTMGHPIIMGRKTFESIGRPLPGRTNIVISRDNNFRAEGCESANSLGEAIEIAGISQGGDESFVIGGSQIYSAALPLADKLYLTKVKTKVTGDTYFQFDPSRWREISCEKHPADGQNQYDFEFCVLERVR